MNNLKKTRKFVSKLLLVFMMLNLLGTTGFARGPEKVTGKPLVVLMEYKDYKFSDIDTKETSDNRVRGLAGKDFTKDYVNDWLFSEDTYKSPDWDGNIRDIISIRKSISQVSGGTYDFNGKVAGPYTAKHDARYYGKDGQESTRYLIEEAIEHVAKDETIDLSEFDVETRRRDVDTNETHITYNKPDGQVDTIIVIHPGIGGEWGGGSLGKDAIHPFRRGFTWYGGEHNLQEYKTKDARGKDWRFDDFLIVAQDGASDIVMHEFGHIMGLPDLYAYDNGQPPVQYWDIMGGSYTGTDIPGDGPIAYGGYNRCYLQKSFEKGNAPFVKWANIKEYDLDEINGQEIDLQRASEKIGNKTDLVKINLPKKQIEIVNPKEGENMFFTGKGNDLRNYMVIKDVDLTEFEEVFLEMDAWYKIDPYFDFVTVRANESGDEKEVKDWATVKGNITTEEFDKWLMENETEEERKERNPGHGITDDSKGWVESEFNLSEYAGKKIDLAFYFHTDTNTPEEGMYFDNISITGVEKGEEIEEPEIPEEPTESETPEDPKEELKENEIGFDIEKEVEIGKEYEVNIKEATSIRIDTDGGLEPYWALNASNGNAVVWKHYPYKDDNTKTYGSTDKKVAAGKYIFKISEENQEKKGKVKVLLTSTDPKKIELNKKTTDNIKFPSFTQSYSLVLEEATRVKFEVESKNDYYWDVKKDGKAILWASRGDKDITSGVSEKELEPGEYIFSYNEKVEPNSNNFSLTVSEYIPEVPGEPEKPIETEKEKDETKDWKDIKKLSADDFTKEGLEKDFDINGFEISNGKDEAEHYYLIEWRKGDIGSVDGGLESLQVWNNLSYDPGMLVWYVNEYYVDSWNKPDQNSGNHPGYVFAGVVDANQHNVGYHWKDGSYLTDKRVDFDVHDATFSLKEGREFRHDWGSGTITEDLDLFMTPDFEDNRDYSNKDNPQGGLILDELGIKLLVLEEKSDSTGGKVKLINKNNINSLVSKNKIDLKDIRVIDKSILEIEAENTGDGGLGRNAFISYKNKATKEEGKAKLFLDGGVYKTSLGFLKDMTEGDYEINFLIFEDKTGNANAIYNSNIHSGSGRDLSKFDLNNKGLEDSDIKPKEEVEVKSIKTKTKDGVEKNEFTKGNLVNVEVEIKTIEKVREGIVVIEALDEDGVPYALRHVKYENARDKYSLGFSTYESKKGMNKVNIYVWNNLLDKTPLSEPITYEFKLK